MEDLIYRKLEKYDYYEVQNIISNAFGLHKYVSNEKVFEKVKKMYLYSCLAEQKFNMVAMRGGQVVGVIMGSSKNDKFKISNIVNTFTLLYYIVSIWFSSKSKSSGYNEVYKAYDELISDMKSDFDGVLTLFAVKEDARGLGIGKELLSKLNSYYKQNNTNKIYLYTDDTCSYGFYDYMGFSRLKEKQINVIRNNKKAELNIYLYALNIEN